MIFRLLQTIANKTWLKNPTKSETASVVRVSGLYESSEAIVAACQAAKNLAPSSFPTDLQPDPIAPDVPAWYKFEHTAWGIGETIRQSFVANPKLKKNSSVIHAIIEVVQERNLRRGRQSFVMLLGFKGAAKYAPLLASLINDPDIDGHVVDTLLKMRVPGFASKIVSLTSHKQAWIRRLAKRYIDRYPDAI